ncbi:MAG TPA: hypothetical protein VMB05_14575 [Solirubrobacteraceae bacterium]|nr:hypothetical protein [Solirubrobacteraceae bacterium]
MKSLADLLAEYERVRDLRDETARALTEDQRLDAIAAAARAGEPLPPAQESPQARAFKVTGINRALASIEREAIEAYAIENCGQDPDDPQVRKATAAVERAYDAHQGALHDGAPRERVADLHDAWIKAVEQKQELVRSKSNRRPTSVDAEQRMSGDELGRAIEAAYGADEHRREAVSRRGEFMRVYDEISARFGRHKGITGEESAGAGIDGSPSEVERQILNSVPRLAGITDDEIERLLRLLEDERGQG